MIITIGTAQLVSLDEGNVPDLFLRDISVERTVEQEVLIIDRGSRRIGQQISVSGLIKDTNVPGLVTLADTDPPTDQPLTINVNGVDVYTANGYISRIGNVTYLAGKVVSSEVGSFVSGDRLARVTLDLFLTS